MQWHWTISPRLIPIRIRVAKHLEPLVSVFYFSADILLHCYFCFVRWSITYSIVTYCSSIYVEYRWSEKPQAWGPYDKMNQFFLWYLDERRKYEISAVLEYPLRLWIELSLVNFNIIPFRLKISKVILKQGGSSIQILQDWTKYKEQNYISFCGWCQTAKRRFPITASDS